MFFTAIILRTLASFIAKGKGHKTITENPITKSKVALALYHSRLTVKRIVFPITSNETYDQNYADVAALCTCSIFYK